MYRISHKKKRNNYHSSYTWLRDRKQREKIFLKGVPSDFTDHKLMSSAHSLGFAFGLLALYPDCQERVFQEVRSFVAEGTLPVCGHSQRWRTIHPDHYRIDIRSCSLHEVHTSRHLRDPAPLPRGVRDP